MGCSGSKKDVSRLTKARQVAYAGQAMVLGAQLGTLGLWDDIDSEREPNPNPYVGKLLFKRYCDSCHANAGKAPNILDKRVNTPDAESDYYVIQYGLTDMPGFRTRLTQFQIYDILSYIGDEDVTGNPSK